MLQHSKTAWRHEPYLSKTSSTVMKFRSIFLPDRNRGDYSWSTNTTSCNHSIFRFDQISTMRPRSRYDVAYLWRHSLFPFSDAAIFSSIVNFSRLVLLRQWSTGPVSSFIVSCCFRLIYLFSSFTAIPSSESSRLGSLLHTFDGCWWGLNLFLR